MNRRTETRGSDSRRQTPTPHRSRFRTLDPLPRGEDYQGIEEARRRIMNRYY